MDVQKWILNRIISPIITWIIITLLTALYSQIKTGSWTGLFSPIPPIYYIVFTFFMITWILLIILMRRHKSSSNFAVAGGSRFGYDKIGDIIYADVVWNVHVPKKHPLELLGSFSGYSANKIGVDSAPRCPECGTELEISNGPIWNTWGCFNCGFKKITRDDVYKTHERVKKILDREIEKQEEMNLKNN